MSFFGEGTTTAPIDVGVIECSIDNYHEAMLSIVAESEGNFNDIMMAIGIHENKTLHESGSTVLNEGAVRSFWDRIKKFFMGILAKIKGVFHNFMSRFDAQFKNGNSFYEKYKKELAEKFSKIDKDKVKFTGYEFTNLADGVGADALGKAATILGVGSVVSAIDHAKIVAEKEKIDDRIEAMRGGLINGSACTESEFSKQLFEHFRKGQSSKEDVSSIVNLAYLTRVLGTKKAGEDIKKSYTQLEKELNAIIKTTEKATDSSVKDTIDNPGDGTHATKTSAFPLVVKSLKAVISAKNQLLGAQMQAIASEISQAKGFASQVIRASIKEGTSWDSFGEGAEDIFGSVKLR